jgi:hypothetical protein
LLYPAISIHPSFIIISAIIILLANVWYHE